MPDASITILVPTFNHEKYIAEAIKSVRDQTIIGSCNVIISDDCSSDDTVEIARRLTRDLPNFTVRQNASNLGIMEHYRLLASLVDTSYLAILEGDDYWHATDKMELQKSLMDSHPEIPLCFTACLVKDEASGAKWHHPGWSPDRHRVVHFLDMLTFNPVATFSNCFYRTASFADAVSVADAKSGYDWLLNMSLASAGGALFAARACTLYRLHANGTWTKLNSKQKRAGIISSLEALKSKVDNSLGLYIDAAIARAHNDR
ncbi:glycosyltransferase involved in cell wall biosynthesis [Rhizobium sp. BK181]|uniref:glycosyltransferase n=1 Tax=Rhizobium sp. BK181 TaxID=2587072 RepID=UPI00160A97DA|nr:glycosyltransferase [Rhizobium sp. BK181]MBB3315488.1 glycosyltransferase involved in cell wall biosynthesis [Rhizobium sp. BK181]